jgi:hypothetical protein
MSGVREVVMEGSGPRSGAASGKPEASAPHPAELVDLGDAGS